MKVLEDTDLFLLMFLPLVVELERRFRFAGMFLTTCTSPMLDLSKLY